MFVEFIPLHIFLTVIIVIIGDDIVILFGVFYLFVQLVYQRQLGFGVDKSQHENAVFWLIFTAFALALNRSSPK